MARFLRSVTCEFGGKTYTLVLDFNAAVHFENATGVSVFGLEDRFADASNPVEAKLLVALVHACLQDQHPEAEVKLAGKILSQDTGIMGKITSAARDGSDSDKGENGKKSEATH